MDPLMAAILARNAHGSPRGDCGDRARRVRIVDARFEPNASSRNRDTAAVSDRRAGSADAGAAELGSDGRVRRYRDQPRLRSTSAPRRRPRTCR